MAGLTANLRGANIHFIAGMINSFPFLILSRPEIRVPADLRGKKIAISRYGSSSDTAVRAVVESYKLRPDKDVIILQAGGQTERFAALRAGAVDAAIVSPPLNLAGRALGFNEVIDLSESGVPYAHQEIVAQKDFIDRNPDLVLRTLRALIEGLAQWKDPAKKPVVRGPCSEISQIGSREKQGPDRRDLPLLQQDFFHQALRHARRCRVHGPDSKEEQAGSEGYPGQRLCEQSICRRIGERRFFGASIRRAVITMVASSRAHYIFAFTPQTEVS